MDLRTGDMVYVAIVDDFGNVLDLVGFDVYEVELTESGQVIVVERDDLEAI
jgi:hypothetical protein